MAKQPATIYVCQNCGHQSRKWSGKCPDCNEFNTFVEEKFRPTAQVTGKTSLSSSPRLGTSFFRDTKPIAYGEIESQDDARIPSGIDEFDRVLGGGIVAGSLVLIGGAPGIGKSTLVAQVADKLSSNDLKVLYVSGEESERQIKMRGERLGLNAENLFLLPETNLDQILTEIERMQPNIVIVDSIQTVFSPGIESAPGSVSQVREVAGQFMMFAKGSNVPVFLIGHVTKEGSIAGPKALEHIVDTVLYFEGDRHHNHRIIRATKNRFGAANEIGIFEMTGEGLKAVGNPSEVFLQERPEGASGSVVTVCMEGTRPMLVEVQALVSGTKFGTGRRMAQGFDYNRTSLLIAVLEKRLGFQLAGDDVFINIAGGLEVDEPAADLGVIAAISSSFRNLQIPPDVAVFGEVGLTGEVRGVLQGETRAREAQTLGFKKLILPASNKKGLEKLLGMRVVGVRNLEEALDELFSNDVSTQNHYEKNAKEKINWINLGKLVGTSGSNIESVDTQAAQRAIEILIGEENLKEAVDYYIDGKPGSELARFVLRQFHPWSAMQYCYEIYKTDGNSERRMFAVELLRSVADKRALKWINEFLEDENPQIQVLGMGILDYLNLKNLIILEDVEEILSRADKHSNPGVREAAQMLREELG